MRYHRHGSNVVFCNPVKAGTRQMQKNWGERNLTYRVPGMLLPVRRKMKNIPGMFLKACSAKRQTGRFTPSPHISRSRPVPSRPSFPGGGRGGGGFALRYAPAVDLSVEWLWEIREKLLTHEYLVLLATVRC